MLNIFLFYLGFLFIHEDVHILIRNFIANFLIASQIYLYCFLKLVFGCFKDVTHKIENKERMVAQNTKHENKRGGWGGTQNTKKGGGLTLNLHVFL